MSIVLDLLTLLNRLEPNTIITIDNNLKKEILCMSYSFYYDDKIVFAGYELKNNKIII